MPNLIDRYLLYRIRTKRDPEAFARIYDRYVASLFRFVLLKAPSKEDAEDLTAEAFTRTWNYLLGHQDVQNVRALLFRISRNLIADLYRKRTEHVSVESVTLDGVQTSTNIESQFHDAGKGQAEIHARAELSLVMQKLDRLKDDYRDVLTLRLIDGLDFGDIATILEKKRGHIRVIYHRALKMLKEE